MVPCWLFLFLLFNSSAREIDGDNGQEKITESWSCKEEMSQMAPICYCDSDCVFYRDCCGDVTDSSYSALSLNPKRECQRIAPKNFPSFWTVTSCPGREAFKRDAISLPVVSEDGTVFADDNIAQCNNVSSFLPMDIYVILRYDLCDVDLTFSSLKKPLMNLVMSIVKSNCRFIFSPKSDSRAFPRLCVDLRQEEMAKDFSSKCNNYMRPEKISSVIYRNAHCFEDMHGYPMPENATDMGIIYKKLVEIGTSLYIGFMDSSSNHSYQDKSICPYKFRDHCHTRLIRNWNQPLEMEVDSLFPIDEYHIKYSSIYFVYNLLQNNVNLTLAERVNIDRIRWKSSRCQTMVITMSVKSTGDLSEEDYNRVITFINLFKLSSFSSLIRMGANESSSKITTSLCTNPSKRREILQRTRVHSFTIVYILRIMKFLGNADEINTYCQNLLVESKERLNRKYVDVYLTKWSCLRNPSTDTTSAGNYDPQSVYITITVLAVSGIVIFVLYFTSLKDANVLDR
ncbi:uncharacterized protein LOC133176410 [Saccostrea echinata]|uniref:uncharacterized protein LOC133176410 n=1 Tax=Saccostrea echinata TaxID=191078 RepID=UPI002A821EEC|nr:uncharacterized protein LOC133176410 [Saccostrea echinata]